MKKKAQAAVSNRPAVCPTCHRPFGPAPRRVCFKCKRPIGKRDKWLFTGDGHIEHRNCKNPENYQ